MTLNVIQFGCVVLWGLVYHGGRSPGCCVAEVRPEPGWRLLWHRFAIHSKSTQKETEAEGLAKD